MSNKKNDLKNEEQMETTENALDPRVNDPGFWKEIWEQVRLVWVLLKDKDVPVYMKLLPLAAIAYVIMPFDLISDFIPGLGQLDDLTAVFLGAKMFIEMAPQDIVNRHIRAMRMNFDSANPDLNEVDHSDKEIDASIVIEGDFEQLDKS